MTNPTSNSDLSFRISAPGKVILYGEHSVVHDKLAIAASLGLRTYLDFSEQPKSAKKIIIEISAVGLIYTCNFNVIEKLQSADLLPLKSTDAPELINHDAFLVIVQDFVKEITVSSSYTHQQIVSLTCIFYLFFGILHSSNIDLQPFTLKITTDLTLSAGTGSSASYAVTLAACFIHYLRIKTDNEKNVNLAQFNSEELTRISKWAYCVEKMIHGLPSGIDNTICTFGSMVEFRKTTGAKFFSTCEFELLLINTKVPRSTKALLNNVLTLKQNHSAIVELILSAMDEIAKSAMACILEISKNKNSTNTELYSKLGELTDMNQHMLQALTVSHPKLDEICMILKNVGLCGKLTGAGGGGYAISIIPPYIQRQTVIDVVDELNEKGYHAILTKLGGTGVSVD